MKTLTVRQVEGRIIDIGNEYHFWAGNFPVYVIMEDGERRLVTSVGFVANDQEAYITLYAGVVADSAQGGSDD